MMHILHTGCFAVFLVFEVSEHTESFGLVMYID